jgi:hypothetical protein
LWRTTLAGVVIEYDSIVTPEGLPGDFNGDNKVDALDYVVWRNNLNGAESVLGGNGDNSGTVDTGDYLLWKLHFGDVAPGALTGAYHVPEPTPAFMLLVCSAAMLLWVDRHQKRPCLQLIAD